MGKVHLSSIRAHVSGVDVGLSAVWHYTFGSVGCVHEITSPGPIRTCLHYVLTYTCIYNIAHQHSRAKNGTDVSLLSVVITAVAPTQSFSASEQGGVNLVQGSRDSSPIPQTPQCPKHRHLAVFLRLILPVLSFPGSS